MTSVPIPLNPSFALIFLPSRNLRGSERCGIVIAMDKKVLKDKILNEVQRILAKDQIKKVSLFGSYLSNSHQSDSDVDVLIEFKPNAEIGFFELSRIQSQLERTLEKRVDLVTPEALSKYFRPKVLSEAETIYEGK